MRVKYQNQNGQYCDSYYKTFNIYIIIIWCIYIIYTFDNNAINPTDIIDEII